MVDSLKAIFGQKIANFLFVSLGQNGPWIMDDCLDRKQAALFTK